MATSGTPERGAEGAQRRPSPALIHATNPGKTGGNVTNLGCGPMPLGGRERGRRPAGGAPFADDSLKAAEEIVRRQQHRPLSPQHDHGGLYLGAPTPWRGPTTVATSWSNAVTATRATSKRRLDNLHYILAGTPFRYPGSPAWAPIRLQAPPSSPSGADPALTTPWRECPLRRAETASPAGSGYDPSCCRALLPASQRLCGRSGSLRVATRSPSNGKAPLVFPAGAGAAGSRSGPHTRAGQGAGGPMRGAPPGGPPRHVAVRRRKKKSGSFPITVLSVR